MKRTKQYPMGTVSHGTLRSQDLIEAFSDELKRLRGAIPRGIQASITEYRRYASRKSENAQETAQDLAPAIIDNLMNALQDFAPPYGYFGAHQGDGADFGFWLDTQDIGNGDALQVSDTSEVPRKYRGEVLHVNDHGNMTLYIATSRGLREVWSVV